MLVRSGPAGCYCASGQYCFGTQCYPSMIDGHARECSNEARQGTVLGCDAAGVACAGEVLAEAV